MVSAAPNPSAPAVPLAEYERQIMVRHLRVGCYLVMVLMPVGVTLDFTYYPELAGRFLMFRVACSLMLVPVAWLLRVEFGVRFYQMVGLFVALLPAFFICWMIYESEGAVSPYYAGLNLILLAIAFVLRWSVALSLITFTAIMLMYIGACALHGFIPDHPGQRPWSEFVNSLYFMFLTGIIVVTGSRFHHILRLRETALSQQLARSKLELEAINEELEGTIEKLRNTQLQLVQSEKRRALGVLAGGIIHDIGNTLNHIRTNLFTLRKRFAALAVPDRAVFDRIFTDLATGTEQAVGTVKRVRLYTHPDVESREAVELSDVLDAAFMFTSSRLREQDVQAKPAQVDPGLCVWGNRQSLVDVFVNLMLNSVDALSAKSFVENDPRVVEVTARKTGDRALVTFRDNGTGIDPAVADRVFDPYFTTKDVGEGTGLGLSTCKEVVEQCGGTISVRSEPGQFCEFTLDFPAREKV